MNKGLKVTPLPSLAERSTIRLGGHAIAEVLVENQDGLELLPDTLRQLGGRPVILGRGSNILAGDGSLPLVLIRLGAQFYKAEVEKVEEDGFGATFKSSAALPLPVLVKKICQAGYAGFSGLAGIPGSVGGAVAMNAGSFDMDIKGTLARVNFYSPAKGIFSLLVKDMDISYRHFAVPGLVKTGEGGEDWFIILSAEFYCPKGKNEELMRETRQYLARKQSTQPVSALSAGCVFKNPEQGAAGRLLQDAGFKGKKKGGMMFSDLHANFLVNTGSGTATEAMELIAEAQERVLSAHGVKLELEVQVWG
jgi:UDP-N-acetylmuramate dehydrogenase